MDCKTCANIVSKLCMVCTRNCPVTAGTIRDDFYAPINKNNYMRVCEYCEFKNKKCVECNGGDKYKNDAKKSCLKMEEGLKYMWDEYCKQQEQADDNMNRLVDMIVGKIKSKGDGQ